jgi:hypothetical protein
VLHGAATIAPLLTVLLLYSDSPASDDERN